MDGVLSGNPEGLFLRIMSWLEVGDLGRCARTCQAWRVMGESDELWEPIHKRRERCVQNAGEGGLWQSAGHFTVSSRAGIKLLEMPCPAEPLVRNKTPRAFLCCATRTPQSCVAGSARMVGACP